MDWLAAATLAGSLVLAGTSWRNLHHAKGLATKTGELAESTSGLADATSLVAKETSRLTRIFESQQVVKFKIEVEAQRDAISALRLVCTGANQWVHWASIVSVGTTVADATEWTSTTSETKLVRDGGPVFLVAGEVLEFPLPQSTTRRSLTGKAETNRRNVIDAIQCAVACSLLRDDLPVERLFKSE
jgi:hypothetical protein